MKQDEPESLPPLGLGLSAVVLGVVGLLLFALPILSIPVSGGGVIVGVARIVAGLLRPQMRLRLAVAGVLLSGVSLGLAVAIALGPSGYFSPRSVFPMLERMPQRHFVPPPAAPRLLFDTNR